jgi:hypothetical protein
VHRAAPRANVAFQVGGRKGNADRRPDVGGCRTDIEQLRIEGDDLLGTVLAAVASVSMTSPKAVALGLIVRCFAPLSEYHIGADQIMLAQIGADGRSCGLLQAFQN